MNIKMMEKSKDATKDDEDEQLLNRMGSCYYRIYLLLHNTYTYRRTLLYTYTYAYHYYHYMTTPVLTRARTRCRLVVT